MDMHTATEVAYKNGYEQALNDFEKKLKEQIDINARWYGRFYKFSVNDSIDDVKEELIKKVTG